MPKHVVIAFLLLAHSAEGAEIDFDRDIATLLNRRCLHCHAGDDAKAKLDLSHKASALAGGESGAGLTPGNLESSLIWQRVADGEMPEDKPLPDHERELLKRWIASGAQWGTDPIDPLQMSTDSRAGYDWWSLQPLAEPKLPPVSDVDWTRNAVDRFVLARLDNAILSPSPPARLSRLVRRLYFDVTGLPPPPSTLDQLKNGPDAYERLVDQLLASPRYGQRWARHWLDVVRFGESHGFEYNQPRNNSWWYRNWVIEALNHDLPYDEFVRQQIAGDVLYPLDENAWAATGFLVAGPHNTTLPSSEKMQMTMRQDELEDIVGTIGQTFLGLTVNCARCHDHKFDPITQKEYYQLVATVVGIEPGERELPDEAAAQAKQDLQVVRGRLKTLRSQQKEQESQPDTAESHTRELQNEIAALTEKEKHLDQIRAPKMYVAISRKPPVISWLRRGDVTLPAAIVQPAGLRAVNPTIADFSLKEDAADAPRRIQLAEWITRNQNAVFARVIVNRLWHYHFGQGLVRTPSDFGFNGDRPSHPELLDYLAGELIRNQWNLKPIHRLILTSATYRQRSRIRPTAVEVDADNRLLWRMNPRRLTAEEIRDSILSVNGKLDDRHGGPGYRDVREYKYRGSHYYDPIEPVGSDGLRRTIYRFSPRGAKRTMLDTFDCPDPSAMAPNRAVTTTPLQALSLMNNRFVLRMADEFAARLEREHRTRAECIRQLYRLSYGREPEPEELTQSQRFIRGHGLTALCRVVFNSNEFLYVR